MEFEKKPKYSVGDVVVNTLYGTVGTITDIKILDGAFLYEINHSNSLYLEHTLVLLSEFEGDLLIAEEIEIQLPFFFGDIVRVKGSESDLYIVVGFRTEIWRYQDESWEEIFYELKSLMDQSYREATSDELITISSNEQTFTFMQEIYLQAPDSHDEFEEEEQIKKYLSDEKGSLRGSETQKEMIDGLLDIYNDYKILHELFDDLEYKKVMELTLNNLRKYLNKRKGE